MKRKRHSEEQIIRILKEAEAGLSAAELVRKYGISEQSFYRWKSEFGGMELTEAKRLKELEAENRRLKRQRPHPSLGGKPPGEFALVSQTPLWPRRYATLASAPSEPRDQPDTGQAQTLRPLVRLSWALLP